MLKKRIALPAMSFLSACTQSTTDPTPPTDTPSATSTESETESATKDPDEAIAAATKVAQEYWSIFDQVIAEGGTHPGRIDAVTTVGGARDGVYEGAASVLEYGVTGSGNRTFTITKSSSSDHYPEGQSAIQNGRVELTGCDDVSALVRVMPDGSAAPNRNIPRKVATLVVIYDPSTTKWMVSEYLTPRTTTPC
jgi:hypothetical protein